jgi:transposase
MEKLLMSQKERKRMTVMAEVKTAKLTPVEAAQVLGLGYRQAKRVWRRYRDQGDKGLVHRLRGKPGARAKPAKTKARILARYALRYPDFGPTLAAEYLRDEGLVVDHETLRRWLLAGGRCGGGGNGTGSGVSASPAWAPWCNWMARITIGLRAVASAVF